MRPLIVMLSILGLLATFATPASAQTVPTFELRQVDGEPNDDGQVVFELFMLFPAETPIRNFRVEVREEPPAGFPPALSLNSCTPVLATGCDPLTGQSSGFAPGGYSSQVTASFPMARYTYDLTGASAVPRISPLVIEVSQLVDMSGAPIVTFETVDTAVAVNGYAGGPETAVSSLNPPTRPGLEFPGSETLTTPRLLALLAAGAAGLAAAGLARRKATR